MCRSTRWSVRSTKGTRHDLLVDKGRLQDARAAIPRTNVRLRLRRCEWNERKATIRAPPPRPQDAANAWSCPVLHFDSSADYFVAPLDRARQRSFRTSGDRLEFEIGSPSLIFMLLAMWPFNQGHYDDS